MRESVTCAVFLFTVLLRAPAVAQDAPEVVAGPSPEASAGPSAADAPGESGSPAPAEGEAAESAPEVVAEPLLELGERLRLGMFGDVLATAWTNRAGQSPGFALGNLDLFLTAELSSQWQALAELVIEGGAGHGAGFGVDLERLQLRFSPLENLSISVGRMHQVLGYWNAAYHHGAFLVTSVDRPRIIAFEDEEGPLPTHMVGVEASAHHEVGSVVLGGTLGISNGRAELPADIAQAGDLNPFKAINFQASLEHPGLRARVGLGALYDVVPQVVSSPGVVVREEIRELIFSAFAVVQPGALRALAEAYALRHQSEGQSTAVSWGAFVEVGYRLGVVTPFARLEAIELSSEGGAFFAGYTDARALTLGARWDVASSVALKAEYRGAIENHAGATQHDIRVQLAFGI